LKKYINLSFKLKNYTYLLLITALLGVHFVSIDLGFIQLSPYRILLILSPFIFLKVKKSTLKQLIQSKNNEYFFYMLLWVVYSFIPLLWIKDFTGWLKVFTFLFSGLLITWFIGLYFIKVQDIIKALSIIEFFTLIFGFLSLYEIFTGNYLFLEENSLEYYQVRSQLYSAIGLRVPVSVYANPNNYAVYLLFAIYSSLALSKIRNSRSGRIYSQILSFFFVFLLLTTQSRAGFIGLVLGFIAYGFIYLKRMNAKSILIFIPIISIALMFLIPWLIKNKELFETLVRINITNTYGSDFIRINLIKNGFIFLMNTFFLGVGLGNIEYHMAHYGIYFTGTISNIHNWWMEILVSSGIFVFILYLIIYLKTLGLLFFASLENTNKKQYYLSIYFFCFLISFSFGSIGPSSLIQNEWIWPIFAVVMSYVNLCQIDNKPKIFKKCIF